jgi:hypothetical protein
MEENEEQERNEKVFFALAERFRAADSEEAEQLGNEIGRFIFGE